MTQSTPPTAGRVAAEARRRYQAAADRHHTAEHEIQQRAIDYAALRAREEYPHAKYLIVEESDAYDAAGCMRFVDLTSEPGSTVLDSDAVGNDLAEAAADLKFYGEWTRHAQEDDPDPWHYRIDLDSVLANPPLPITTSNGAGAPPVPHAGPEAPAGIESVTTFVSDDGVDAVQIDTHPGGGRLRINLNDGAIWDGDPEDNDLPLADQHEAATILRELADMNDDDETLHAEAIDNAREDFHQLIRRARELVNATTGREESSP